MKKIIILSLGAIILFSEQLLAASASILYLENEYLKVGINESAGGVISYLTDKDRKINYVNGSDFGRFIQLSLYGNPDGSKWEGSPTNKEWMWNPVQAGSAQGEASNLIQINQDKDKIYVKLNPRNWAGGQILSEIVFEQTVELKEDVVHIKYKVIYNGTTEHQVKDQEVPALFLNPSLTDFVYDSGKGLQTIAPGFPNQNAKVSNSWAAFVKNNYGVGVYTPGVKNFAYYFFKDDPACAYMTPLMNFKIGKGFEKEMETFITIGTVEEIKARFQKLKK